MERVKTRGADGRQASGYYKPYYQENKERIAKQFKENYQRMKADPVLLKEHQVKCAEATRRYRQRHPDRVVTLSKINRLNRRIKAFEKLGGAICRRCGCTTVEFLEFNHINGGGCKEIKELGNRMAVMVMSGQRGKNDYEVLCRVCNALDHLERKNKEAASLYRITWENFTGKKANCTIK